MKEKLRILLVGGGSSAHVLAPLLSRAGHEVSILTSRPSEWMKEITVQIQDRNERLLDQYSGTILQVSSDPSVVVPQSNVIILCMPVFAYRSALRHIAPFLMDKQEVFVGTVYGQAGFNWMVEEVKQQFNLPNISYFAFGLLPWICRTIKYGQLGVTYGVKAINVAAVQPNNAFDYLNKNLFCDICERWFGKGRFVQSTNFLSLTLSVDNQIIHPARCYGLYLSHGGCWERKSDIPYFYRDFDEQSATILRQIDNEYSTIRNYFKNNYPKYSWDYMLDYLALERFSYQSDNTDIRTSFTTSKTLGAIKPPVISDSSKGWKIDTGHRFFTDDIFYGLCIAKWIAEQIQIDVVTIDSVLEWAQNICKESIIENKKLKVNSDICGNIKYGIPPSYNRLSISEILD